MISSIFSAVAIVMSTVERGRLLLACHASLYPFCIKSEAPQALWAMSLLARRMCGMLTAYLVDADMLR